MKYLAILLISLIYACSQNLDKKTDATTNVTAADSTIKNKYIKIISDSTNILEIPVQTIELQYTLWGCSCPQWINVSDASKSRGDEFKKKHIYIEPSDTKLYYPDSSFNFESEHILVTGQFYKRADYPKGTLESEEPMTKAKVFRYTKIKVLKKH